MYYELRAKVRDVITAFLEAEILKANRTIEELRRKLK
jgi:hypothetical protein